MKKTIDVLITNARIFDGCGGEPYFSDIAITGDKISKIGKIPYDGSCLVIDAKGLAISPGFIDSHSHSDFTIIADPRAEGKIMQGITTEVNGNCGMSAAPLYGEACERREEDLRELDIRERWNTMHQYVDIIGKRGIAVNSAMLAGHGNIRGSVMGYADRQPSPSELKKMAALLTDTISQGALGFSTGLIYPPGVYSYTEELVSLSKTLCDKDLIYTTHMRSEGAELMESVEEVLRIGREAGVRVHISHLKTSGEPNWGKADRVISLLEGARKAGVAITCDRYPYTASSTDLDSILPPWIFAGGNSEELRRLGHDADRKKILLELEKQTFSAGYWQRIIVSSVSTEKNRWMEGKTITEISSQLGTEEANTLFHILIEEKLRAGAIFLSMCEENLNKFLSLPFCMIGSDSSARCFEGPTRRGKPHPRTFGTFPRFIGRYSRDEKLLPLPAAVHKATLLAARTFRLKKRGCIKEGMYADIVVFDQEKIIDCATFDDPFRKPDGIYYVLVNGTVAVWEGIATGRLGGRVLSG